MDGSHRTTYGIARPVPTHERVRLQDGLAGDPRSLAALHVFLRLHRARRGGPGRRGALCREPGTRSEEHTSELQSRLHLVCRLLLEKKKKPPQVQSRLQLRPLVKRQKANPTPPRIRRRCSASGYAVYGEIQISTRLPISRSDSIASP